MGEMINNYNFIKIRAHHLLCIQGFQGYGYSQDFVDNMAMIIKNIDLNPDLEIEIILDWDVICSHCPHNVKGICQRRSDSAQKIKAMDVNVLRKLDLKEGARGRAKDFFYLVNMKLRNRSDIQDICGNCEWKEKCLWYISRGK